MKKSLFAFSVVILSIFLFTSCEEDNRTGDYSGFDGCVICNGDGYVIKEELLGLSVTYFDCFSCKSRYNNMMNYGGYGSNPSFQGGGSSIKGPCKICNHCDKYDGIYCGYWPSCSCGHSYAGHYTE